MSIPDLRRVRFLKQQSLCHARMLVSNGAPMGDPRQLMGAPESLTGVSKLAYDAVSDADSVEGGRGWDASLVDSLETVAGVVAPGDEAVELAELRSWVTSAELRHNLFQSHLAPLGRTLGPYVQDTGHTT